MKQKYQYIFEGKNCKRKKWKKDVENEEYLQLQHQHQQ